MVLCNPMPFKSDYIWMEEDMKAALNKSTVNTGDYMKYEKKQVMRITPNTITIRKKMRLIFYPIGVV